MLTRGGTRPICRPSPPPERPGRVLQTQPAPWQGIEVHDIMLVYYISLEVRMEVAPGRIFINLKLHGNK